MATKSFSNFENSYNTRTIITSGILGGIIGAIISFLIIFNIYIVPFIGNILIGSPFGIVVTGIFLGIAAGLLIGSIISLSKSSHVENAESDQNSRDSTIQKMELHEERLDIHKNLVKTGEVTMDKEVITEDKTIVVPVTREELIIKTKTLSDDSGDKSNISSDVIRIPISEERIEVTKHPVALEDVSVHTHQYRDIVHVDETLKKETLDIKTHGHANVVNKNKKRRKK